MINEKELELYGMKPKWPYRVVTGFRFIAVPRPGILNFHETLQALLERKEAGFPPLPNVCSSSCAFYVGTTQWTIREYPKINTPDGPEEIFCGEEEFGYRFYSRLVREPLRSLYQMNLDISVAYIDSARIQSICPLELDFASGRIHFGSIDEEVTMIYHDK